MRRAALLLALVMASPARAQPVPDLPKPKSREECNAFYGQYLRLIPSDVSRMTIEQQDFHANVMAARSRCWKVADGGRPGAAAAPAAPPVSPAPAEATPASGGIPVISSFQELESR